MSAGIVGMAVFGNRTGQRMPACRSESFIFGPVTPLLLFSARSSAPPLVDLLAAGASAFALNMRWAFLQKATEIITLRPGGLPREDPIQNGASLVVSTTARQTTRRWNRPISIIGRVI